MNISTGKDTHQPFSFCIPQIHAVGLTTRKSRGEAAEAAFLAKAASLGFGVAKPWGDSERYDFIVDSGYNFWRVQVKSTRSQRGTGYIVVTAGRDGTRYNESEIDFLVAHIVAENVWYIIPVGALGSRRSLNLYTRGPRKSQMEKYREAWCQMACPHREDGPSHVLVPRLCQQVRLCDDRCPLCD